jgi:hypothetical protein
MAALPGNRFLDASPRSCILVCVGLAGAPAPGRSSGRLPPVLRHRSSWRRRKRKAIEPIDPYFDGAATTPVVGVGLTR